MEAEIETHSRPQSTSNVKRIQQVKEALEAYLYLAPTLIILSIFVFYPIVDSFNLSLTRTSPFGGDGQFIGTGNYERLWREFINGGDYWTYLKVSFWFTIATVPTGIFLSVVLAIALSYPVRNLSWLHRLLIFIPVVISSAVTGVIFRWLYNPNVGYLNYWLTFLGVEQGPNWLTSKEWALIAVSIAVVWRQLGFNTIIALAGVQNIDETLYEAAKIDGASLFNRIRFITIPMLSPTLLFLLIINVINSLQTFGEINILTDGGPGGSTTNMIYAIYIDAFVGTQQRGFASAQAYLLAIIIMIVSLIQFRGFGKRVHYS